MNMKLTKENKVILANRSMSFVWRLGGMVAAMLLNFTADNLGLFDLSPMTVTVIGLVIGEITKYLNRK